MMNGYQFTEYFFGHLTRDWSTLFSIYRTPVRKVLEIGSFEGGSAVWILENLLKEGGEIHCIDRWQAEIDRSREQFEQIEARFDHNVALAASRTKGANVFKHKGTSQTKLIELLAGGHRNSFDVVYVDGSHFCADVLADVVAAFQLCKVNGLIICDDYLWKFDENLSVSPKLAIDSFVNCYHAKISVLAKAPLYQLYFVKTKE